MRKILVSLKEGATLPVKKSATAAGFDLSVSKNVCLYEGSSALVETGVSMAIPAGYYGQVSLRSGLWKEGIIMPNGVGVIDSDYRGEIKIPVLCVFGKFEASAGDRIAQIVILRIDECEMELGSLDYTERGSGGFGHTGR